MTLSRTLLRALPVLLLVVLAAGCATPGTLQPNTVLTRADNDRLIKVEFGQVIEVRVPENPATGMRWDIDRVDAPVLVALGAGKESPSAKETGPVIAVFKFRADRSGRGMIRLVYRHPWEQAMKSETLVILIQVR